MVGGTRLPLRHTLAVPDMRAMVAAGWHPCTEVLSRRLDGEPVPVIRGGDAINVGFEGLRTGDTARLGLAGRAPVAAVRVGAWTS